MSLQEIGLYWRIGKGSVRMNDGAGGEFGVRVPSRAQDVHDTPAASEHVVGDQPAVTLPPDGLGAHESRGLLRRKRNELVECAREVVRFGVVRVVAERIDAPESIARTVATTRSLAIRSKRNAVAAISRSLK